MADHAEDEHTKKEENITGTTNKDETNPEETDAKILAERENDNQGSSQVEITRDGEVDQGSTPPKSITTGNNMGTEVATEEKEVEEKKANIETVPPEAKPTLDDNDTEECESKTDEERKEREVLEEKVPNKGEEGMMDGKESAYDQGKELVNENDTTSKETAENDILHEQELLEKEMTERQKELAAKRLRHGQERKVIEAKLKTIKRKSERRQLEEERRVLEEEIKEEEKMITKEEEMVEQAREREKEEKRRRRKEERRLVEVKLKTIKRRSERRRLEEERKVVEEKLQLEEAKKKEEMERLAKAKRRALKVEKEKKAKQSEEEQLRFLEEKRKAELKFREREASIQLRENRIAKKSEKLELCLDIRAVNERALNDRDQDFRKMIQNENR